MVKLTDQERSILVGSEGEVRRIALQMMVDYAEALGAENLLDVEDVSVGFPCRKPEVINAGQSFDTFEDMLCYAALASDKRGLRFPPMKARRCASNNAGMTKEWLDYLGVEDKALYECVDEEDEFYRTHGINRTCTCAPYLVGHIPAKGSHVVTGESSQVIFENSVLGARTNVEGDIAISCAAIVGKIPNCGLHLDENRKGTHLVKVKKIPANTYEWALMGYWIGKHVGIGIPVIDIDIRNITFDEHKSFGSAMTTAGQIDLYHVIGHTPEAPTYEAAFKGNVPKAALEYGAAQEEEIRHKLNWSDVDAVDLVLLGCPHYSIYQLAEAARILKGRKLNSRLVIMTAPGTMKQAEENGDAQLIRESGGFLTSCCPPMVALWPENITVLATDSVKMAHYVPSTKPDYKIHAGGMAQCIEAAIAGKW